MDCLLKRMDAIDSYSLFALLIDEPGEVVCYGGQCRPNLLSGLLSNALGLACALETPDNLLYDQQFPRGKLIEFAYNTFF
jgi:hypothetical protein